jgi:hypothetical protein
MAAFRAGSVASVLVSTVIYISLQFKFVNKSLEDLNNIENSESQKVENTLSTPGKQHECEESSYRNIQVPATDGESFHTLNQTQVPECSNQHTNTDTSITTVNCVQDQEHTRDSYRLPTENKPLPEDCVIPIIKNHQEAFS